MTRRLGQAVYETGRLYTARACTCPRVSRLQSVSDRGGEAACALEFRHVGAAALQAYPYLELYRLPSSRPQLQVIERLWKVLQRCAPHTRFFLTAAALKKTLRYILDYYETLHLVHSPSSRGQRNGQNHPRFE